MNSNSVVYNLILLLAQEIYTTKTTTPQPYSIYCPKDVKQMPLVSHLVENLPLFIYLHKKYGERLILETIASPAFFLLSKIIEEIHL